MRSAWLGFATALVALSGCAKIKGHSDVGQMVSPVGGDSGAAGDGDQGGPLPSGDGDSSGDGDVHEPPIPDASTHGGDGDTAHDSGTPPLHDAGQPSGDDAGHPPTNTTGTCAMPNPITAPENGGVVTINGDTRGAADSIVTPCAKTVFFAVTGPEQVYQLQLPYDAELQITVTPRGLFGTFQGTVYLLSSCGSAQSQLACNFDGSLPYGNLAPIKANTPLFLYVDSGGRNVPGVLMTPSEGQFTMELDIRKIVGEGQACGTGATDPACASGLGCVQEASGNVCRVCGDGVACPDAGTGP
jgi:hypothetical protein